jgi:hypothetical protein
MRSKEHTAPTAPLVLHCTRIHKCAIKKFGINGQMRIKLLFDCHLSNTLKGSRRMGGRRIYLKIFRASLFNEDLSNEPNFGQIHLAGQYLREINMLENTFSEADALSRYEKVDL